MMVRPTLLLTTLCLLFASLATNATAFDSNLPLHRQEIRLNDAERAMLRVERYATAQRLTAQLIAHLQLAPGCAREIATQTVEHLLGTDTAAGYLDVSTDVRTLDQLLDRFTAPMQRALAPVLPAVSYERYVALLDACHVKAK